jgi:hypothetical protein
MTVRMTSRPWPVLNSNQFNYRYLVGYINSGRDWDCQADIVDAAHPLSSEEEFAGLREYLCSEYGANDPAILSTTLLCAPDDHPDMYVPTSGDGRVHYLVSFQHDRGGFGNSVWTGDQLIFDQAGLDRVAVEIIAREVVDFRGRMRHISIVSLTLLAIPKN